MSNRKLLRNSLTTLAMLSIATLVVISVATFFEDSLIVVSAVQQQERLLHRLPVEQGEPIVITDIKVNRQSVSFDQKFGAGDDWMKGLVFTVKNRSDKLILVVYLQFQFPRPPGVSEQISVSHMFYGNPDLLARKPTSEERLVGFAPGQTVDIHLTSEDFGYLQSFLSDTHYGSSIEKVNFRINEVLFEDDTMWSGGSQLLRDSKDSSHWIVTPSSSVTRSAAYRALIARKFPARSFPRDRMSGVNDGYWSFRHPAISQVEQQFSHASSTMASPPRADATRSSAPTAIHAVFPVTRALTKKMSSIPPMTAVTLRAVVRSSAATLAAVATIASSRIPALLIPTRHVPESSRPSKAFARICLRLSLMSRGTVLT